MATHSSPSRCRDVRAAAPRLRPAPPRTGAASSAVLRSAAVGGGGCCRAGAASVEFMSGSIKKRADPEVRPQFYCTGDPTAGSLCSGQNLKPIWNVTTRGRSGISDLMNCPDEMSGRHTSWSGCCP